MAGEREDPFLFKTQNFTNGRTLVSSGVEQGDTRVCGIAIYFSVSIGCLSFAEWLP